MENLNLDIKDLIDDPDMQSAELDEITLSRKKTIQGLILFLVCSIIGIVVFFGSITHADRNGIQLPVQQLPEPVWSGRILDPGGSHRAELRSARILQIHQ